MQVLLKMKRLRKFVITYVTQDVKELKGYTKKLVSMQGLGYKEILDVLNGEISLERAVYLIKRDTRHFAKRQLTWFRRDKRMNFLYIDDYASADELADAACRLIERGAIGER